MKLDAQYYNLTQSLGGAFYAAMMGLRGRSGETAQPQPPSPLLQIQAGMAESPGWFLVQAAEFDPEPLTVANLRVRDIYASPRMVAALLEVMAANDWFDRRGDEFFLTGVGRSLVQARRDSRDKWMAALEPLLQVDIKRLHSLLNRVIEASLESDPPPGSWCLALSRRRAPRRDAANTTKLFQYVADINAFRDDAHMAAWRPHEMEGFVWEAFSLVAMGAADGAETLFKRLSHRGYSRGDYANALGQLAERGWLTPSSSKEYSLAEAGKAIHESGEHLTDHYFYAPWRASLNEAEIAEAADLMVQLRDELNQMA